MFLFCAESKKQNYFEWVVLDDLLAGLRTKRETIIYKCSAKVECIFKIVRGVD